MKVGKIKITKEDAMQLINNPLFKLLWYSLFITISVYFIGSAKVQPLEPDKVIKVAVESFRTLANENLFPEMQSMNSKLDKVVERNNLQKSDFIKKQSGKIDDLIRKGIDDLKWIDIKTARRYYNELEEDKQIEIIKEIAPYINDINVYFEKNKHKQN